jgi:Na+/H+ antiporter NhaD/arsenite permease-like protein
MFSIPVCVLIVVFILIAFRQVGNLKLQIWQIMLFGAVTVLITGQIFWKDALNSINIDVMLFLFGMFIVGQALEESGYLSYLSYKLFAKAKTVDGLIIFILFGMGIASALLMNDTLAIIGTPIVLVLARKHKIHSKLLLLALAFAVTIGSVMSTIGNPQNLLIALNGNVQNPFVTFLKYLFIPTLINLLFAYFVLKFFYKEHFHEYGLNHIKEPIKDKKLALLSKISLSIVVVLILVKIIFVSFRVPFDFRLTYIALIAALPVLVISPKRLIIFRKIDWQTLIFFAAMFVLMDSVWRSGVFQSIINGSNLNITSSSMILTISVLMSQLLSNVPLVALYMPMLIHLGASTKEMIALAAGSTIAGNLFILGAASNVIIIQNAEKRGGGTITFLEFAKVGVPLTVINILVYWIFLLWV